MVESRALLKLRASKGHRGFESLPHRASGEAREIEEQGINIGSRESANLRSPPLNLRFRIFDVRSRKYFRDPREMTGLPNRFDPAKVINSPSHQP